ncbi:MAG TPA: ATP-binding cassette domain-containing protein [Treponemataceae bacterium]|nr:ATP-binding cassette domain-containing protein [Treponemataceae bacterium]
MPIIETKDLTKTYKRYKKAEGLRGSLKGLIKREYEVKNAVSSFDLGIEEGEFTGLIGPNGAGKTTLIKMLTGIIAPTSGTISVMGYYPNKLENAFKKQYAVVMGQKSQLFFELTANDTLSLFKEIYDIPKPEFEKSRDYFVELFNVKDLMNVQVRNLSLGERMKMELITALLHNPRVLFLDEPTIGLDAIAVKQIRGFLKNVNEEKGTTVLLTSHYMEDIKQLCKRSIVINNGKKIFDGTTETLFTTYQKYKVLHISFADSTSMRMEDSLLKNCSILESDEYKVSLQVPKESSSKILDYLFKSYTVQDIVIEEEDIGTVVERMYS